MPQGKVQMTVNLSSNLTPVKVVGKPTIDDFIFWANDYYSGSFTSSALWDLVDADLSEIESGITTEQILTYIRMLNEAAANKSRVGKTAYVVDYNTTAHRLFTRVESIAEKEDSPVERKTFTDLAKAKQWLGV